VTTNATVEALTVTSTNEPLNLGTNGTVLTVKGDLRFASTVYTKGGLYTLENLWNGQPGGVPANVTGTGAIELWRPAGTTIMLR